ncbi:ATP-binding protein [Nonomuraea sp. NPDC000554]|uniref:ATP-binding protein n=1 Tax=Nonomuraea sp. NPDC000554 TaxID=3154259 RepID=UPI003320163A
MIARLWGRFVALLSGHPVVPHRASWTFAAKPVSIPRARRLTRAQLEAWGFDGQSEVAELLVTELTTNAMRHTRTTFRLSLSVEDGLLRCEVEDADPRLPFVRTARLDDERGRGLHLVDMLACCWGAEPAGPGKIVWFELPALVLPALSPCRPALKAYEPS